MSLWARIKRSALYRSIYRNDYPDTPRNQALVILNSLVLHLHPVKVPRRALRVSYTWGLGGLALLMFLILTATGIWLMFYYVPAVPGAYESMHLLKTGVIFGPFTRNLHRWAAHGMVIAVWLHMTRVLFTGAYKPPREFNWVLGLLLFITTVLLAFTGYLLPWDQLAYWAVTVGTNMVRWVPFVGGYLQRLLLGGFELGQATLIRWYTLHVILLPMVCVGLMATHFWRIRKDGGISTPIPEADEREVDPAAVSPHGSAAAEAMVHTWPHLVSIEAIMAVAMLLALSVMATLVDAPLLEMANPDITPDPVKAPWYLVGLQELLLHMHPTLAGVLVPATALVCLGMIPYIDQERRGTGIWFGIRGARIALLSGAYTAAAVIGLILVDEYLVVPGMPPGAHGIAPSLNALLVQLGVPGAYSDGIGLIVMPLLIMAALPWGLLRIIRRVFRNPDRRELIIALYGFFLASFLVLTIIGTAFRGPGMQLLWPWDASLPT